LANILSIVVISIAVVYNASITIEKILPETHRSKSGFKNTWNSWLSNPIDELATALAHWIETYGYFFQYTYDLIHTQISNAWRNLIRVFGYLDTVGKVYNQKTSTYLGIAYAAVYTAAAWTSNSIPFLNDVISYVSAAVDTGAKVAMKTAQVDMDTQLYVFNLSKLLYMGAGLLVVMYSTLQFWLCTLFTVAFSTGKVLKEAVFPIKYEPVTNEVYTKVKAKTKKIKQKSLNRIKDFKRSMSKRGGTTTINLSTR
jgi:hypothetical protein